MMTKCCAGEMVVRALSKHYFTPAVKGGRGWFTLGSKRMLSGENISCQFLMLSPYNSVVQHGILYHPLFIPTVFLSPTRNILPLLLF